MSTKTKNTKSGKKDIMSNLGNGILGMQAKLLETMEKEKEEKNIEQLKIQVQQFEGYVDQHALLEKRNLKSIFGIKSAVQNRSSSTHIDQKSSLLKNELQTILRANLNDIGFVDQIKSVYEKTPLKKEEKKPNPIEAKLKEALTAPPSAGGSGFKGFGGLNMMGGGNLNMNFQILQQTVIKKPVAISHDPLQAVNQQLTKSQNVIKALLKTLNDVIEVAPSICSAESQGELISNLASKMIEEAEKQRNLNQISSSAQSDAILTFDQETQTTKVALLDSNTQTATKSLSENMSISNIVLDQVEATPIMTKESAQDYFTNQSTYMTPRQSSVLLLENSPECHMEIIPEPKTEIKQQHFETTTQTEVAKLSSENVLEMEIVPSLSEDILDICSKLELSGSKIVEMVSQIEELHELEIAVDLEQFPPIKEEEVEIEFTNEIQETRTQKEEQKKVETKPIQPSDEKSIPQNEKTNVKTGDNIAIDSEASNLAQEIEAFNSSIWTNNNYGWTGDISHSVASGANTSRHYDNDFGNESSVYGESFVSQQVSQKLPPKKKKMKRRMTVASQDDLKFAMFMNQYDKMKQKQKKTDFKKLDKLGFKQDGARVSYGTQMKQYEGARRMSVQPQMMYKPKDLGYRQKTKRINPEDIKPIIEEAEIKVVEPTQQDREVQVKIADPAELEMQEEISDLKKLIEESDMKLSMVNSSKTQFEKSIEGHIKREQEYVSSIDQYKIKLEQAEIDYDQLRVMKQNIQSTNECHCNDLLEIIEMAERRNLKVDQEIYNLMNLNEASQQQKKQHKRNNSNNEDKQLEI